MGMNAGARFRMAFSPDGRWLASIDTCSAVGDERQAGLLIHDAATGRQEKRVAGAQRLLGNRVGREVAGGGLSGFHRWLHWDEWKDRFRSNTPTPLEDQVAPDFLAFSSSGAHLPDGEKLAWATRIGEFGVINVGDHRQLRRRVTEDPSDRALTGLGWLADGSLITAEGGRLLVRPYPELRPAERLVCVRACVLPGRAGRTMGSRPASAMASWATCWGGAWPSTDSFPPGPAIISQSQRGVGRPRTIASSWVPRCNVRGRRRSPSGSRPRTRTLCSRAETN